jgi:hypothetical protein
MLGEVKSAVGETDALSSDDEGRATSNEEWSILHMCDLLQI